VWVYSRDRRRWEAKEKWRRRRDEEAAGCIKQQVADTLCGSCRGNTTSGCGMSIVRVGMWVNQYDVFCGVVVNGVRLSQPHCRTAEKCVRQILEDYRRKVERLSTPSPPPPPDPAEELLRGGLSWRHSALIG
jgi:hypothetical protein